jgi:hypothetical protein
VVSCSHFAQPAPPTSAVTLGTLHAPADRQESGHFNIATDRVFCYRTRWLSRQPPKPIQPSEPLASAVPTRENLAHTAFALDRRRRLARRRASFSRASARPAKTSASLRSPSPAKAAKTATRHPVGRSSFCRRPVHRSIVYARSRQSAILHCHQHDNRQGQRLRAEDHQAVHRDARHATAGAGANQTRRLSVCTWRRARRPGSRSPCITC